MSPDIKDFYGQDVPAAIKDACETLGVAQEQLSIEVIETGSKGIFGLIRKKAHIRVTRQSQSNEPPAAAAAAEVTPAVDQPVGPPPSSRETAVPKPVVTKSEMVDEEVAENDGETDADGSEDDDERNREPVELSEESLAIIKVELQRLLELMECPSEVTVEQQEGSVLCRVSDSYAPILTSQEGRTLDSLQYLLRKIVSRKLPGRIQLSIDVGDYRARRNEQLRDQALHYATQVKQDGKTQVIASLNPSERRVVHVCLQDDPEVRSRSIGEGLFKKVLIYKPGKPRKTSGRKRSRGGPRKKSTPRQNQ
ncbi:MAG: Jag N-terminal domain-containing protein [Desulfofustis sp.]|jgi:spoIIIJ-associated protein|nr:Jag N-terminal domain-containing protein [Desulfofustis sp.]